MKICLDLYLETSPLIEIWSGNRVVTKKVQRFFKNKTVQNIENLLKNNLINVTKLGSRYIVICRKISMLRFIFNSFLKPNKIRLVVSLLFMNTLSVLN